MENKKNLKGARESYHADAFLKNESYYVEVLLKNNCEMTQSFHNYEYEKAKNTFDAMREHKDVAFVRLVQCTYLFEAEGGK